MLSLNEGKKSRKEGWVCGLNGGDKRNGLETGAEVLIAVK